MATENYDMYMPNYSNYADIKALVNNFNIIDNGLALNVGSSTGTGNNYILDIGTITLTSTNKGIRFMFFADKDSDTTNTVKIVINNKTYILLDMNKKNVRKIKKGVPITIAYAGDDTNFFLASGGEVTDYESTSIATDGSNVLAPNTFVGSDGEIHTGTMSNNGVKTKQLAINETYTLGKGYYDSITVNQNITTKGSQIYTPSRNDQIIYANQYLNGNQTIKGDSNFLAENIKEGISLFGTLGTCTIQSMGGVKMESGSSAISYSAYGSNPYYNAYLNINPSFTPKLVIMYPNFDYNRCQTIFITNLFDKNKIYRQVWQGTSSDTTKRQIGTSIIDYDVSMMTNIYLGNLRQNNEQAVTWFAFG